ncbi:DedA family protein [Microbacterium jejuense]|uniref:DedA family protein n=1 Tax=Microbacterium jejuense TaxID=1263637 RepID=UPI0031E503CE
MDFLSDLILQAAASPWLLLVMFGAAVIDGFFPPIPSETVLVAAAAVTASSGAGDIVLLCAVAAVGAAIGDNVAYAIGRAVGVSRWPWMRRPRVAATVQRAQHALEHRGAPLILAARYVPVGRVAVNMSAGALRYPWRRFLPLSVLAGATWAAYSAVIGVMAGAWLKDQPLLSAVIGVAFALLIGVVVERVAALRRRRAAKEAATAAERAERRPAEVAG